MKIIAHRSGPTVFPEQTIRSALFAKENGADLVEIDVRFTKDKKLAVSHDENAARVFGVDKNIGEMSSDEFAALRHKNAMDLTSLTTVTDTFCSEIEAAGYQAGLYFNQQLGYEELHLPSLQGYTFWLAEYNDTPSFTYDFDLWQYASDGSVDGIDGDVDLNLAFIGK